MANQFKSIKRVIKKRSSPHIIQRFDRKNGHYNEDGIWIDEKETVEYVSLHSQPIVDNLSDGFEGQTQRDTRRGWSVDITKIRNKDVITIGDGLYTVSNMRFWDDVYKTFDLTRSGETDNVAND